jgi:hypothetical protein
MSLSATPSVAPVMEPAVAPVMEPKTLTGTLAVSNEFLGRFIGKGGINLKKYVTGKSAFQVSKEYEKNFQKDSELLTARNVIDETSKTMTVPSELGSILVHVKMDKGEENLTYKISLINNNEDLSKYLGIVKNNLVKHAENFSKEKLPEDKFSHKIVFATSIEYEGIIGKFIGGGGKNIKMLSSKVKKVFDLPFCFIAMKIQEDMARKSWENKVIRLPSASSKIEVHVIVSMNLPRDSLFGDVLKKLTPIISESVKKLSAPPPHQNKVSEISASDFLAVTDWGDNSDCYDPNDGESPTYTPNGAESPTYTPDPDPSPW